jgi:protein involved in polysaccharide export with SLBB domain
MRCGKEVDMNLIQRGRPVRASRSWLKACAALLLFASASLSQDLEAFRKALGGNASGDISGMDFRKPMPGVDEEMLSQSPLEASAIIGDGPLDSLYIIGPGDQFQVYIESAALDKQVNAEGNIIINRIGVVPVAGLTLKEAKRAIMEKVQSKKIKSQCFVNLGRPKTMKVFITGAVNLPGSYQISGYHHLTDLLALAQGPSSVAQRGLIRITSRTGERTDVHLKKFYLEGDLASNPYLTQGATVYVPYLDYNLPTVQIRRDSLMQTIQLDPGESLPDLLLKAWTFKMPPPYTSITVMEADGKVKFLAPMDVRDFKPSAGSTIEVVSLRKEVYIGGAVFRPGFIAFRSNLKVAQYISEAGLISSSRIPDKITVYRADGSHAVLRLGQDVMQPGDMVFVDQNAEQKFINYTPILLSIASLTLAILTVMK